MRPTRKPVMASEPRVHSASFCQAGKLRDAGRRRRRWCHDHARSKRRPAGMESSLPMLVPSSAIFTAARSRVWAHLTTCCATSSRRRAAACAEVGNRASIDRIGVWRAGTYHISTVCHAACVGSSQKRRQIDRSDQHAYRGAASELPMVPEARHRGHSRSVMVSVRPVLSTAIIV